MKHSISDKWREFDENQIDDTDRVWVKYILSKYSSEKSSSNKNGVFENSYFADRQIGQFQENLPNHLRFSVLQGDQYLDDPGFSPWSCWQLCQHSCPLQVSLILFSCK